MKRKALEKIPYKKIDSIPKGYKYLAIAFVKIIAKERHLIVDVYNRQNLTMPVVRNCYTLKDFDAYITDKDIWTQMQIVDYYSRTRWEEITNHAGKTYISEEHDKKIKQFLKSIKVYCKENWLGYLRRLEQDVKFKREQRTHENKKKKLEERCSMVPDVPEDFRNWVSEKLLNESFIYYQRKGRYATFFCSHCGNEYTYATQAKDSYEGAFEHIVNVPVHNQRGRCEKCDAKAIFKAAGKTNGVYCRSTKVFIGQSIGNGAAVIRYFQADKYYLKDVRENIKLIEISRTYYIPGQEAHTDYHKYDGYMGKEFWDYRNLGGMSNIRIDDGHIYPATWDELAKTELKYSGAEAFTDNYDTYNLVRYMTAYHNYPSIEVMSKIGMYKMVDALIREPWSVDIIKHAPDPLSMLKIDKRQLNILKAEHGDTGCLKVLQLENRLKQIWTEEQRDIIRKLNPDKGKFEKTMKYMSIQKYINAIERYAGTTFEAECSSAVRRLRETSIKYLDYLDMRQRRGYDMTNSIYLFPKDLDQAHVNMVIECEQNKLDDRIRYVESEYPDIKKHYKRNYKKYHYEDGEFIIRPARSAEEIVKEGRILHHCVGTSDNYLNKHNTDESFILMLRAKKKPDIPYITVEIKNNSIIQWFGAYDEKPDKANMDKWINAYVLRLKCQSSEVNTGVEAV